MLANDQAGNDRATRAVEGDDVPGQREKSKFSEAFDTVAGPLQAAAPGNSGSSDIADKLKEGLKGGNPAT
ncbi:hypothetical protein BDY17DRAFT_291447 [Neohortaea acidophila]|uniref:Uncharacterized protein n=1 Tax=Neohortaea acidophila TaxID=245834 RepID=A0A6A6Q4S1_9PEZI|nr:uncharacterized protein BDY17DRAFT_291447 [Neohortaea acidophila]KAF2486407.1 hypothetical protein BDY17DRAFT_291447 [Neohortaea acidophila]